MDPPLARGPGLLRTAQVWAVIGCSGALLQTLTKAHRAETENICMSNGTTILNHTALKHREKFSRSAQSGCRSWIRDRVHCASLMLYDRFEEIQRERGARLERHGSACGRFRIRRHGLPALCANEGELYRIHLFCAVHSVFDTRMPAGEQTRVCFVNIGFVLQCK